MLPDAAFRKQGWVVVLVTRSINSNNAHTSWGGVMQGNWDGEASCRVMQLQPPGSMMQSSASLIS